MARISGGHAAAHQGDVREVLTASGAPKIFVAAETLNPRFNETPAPAPPWPFFVALAAVWGWLFYVPSGEWEANQQYSHGWFIPLLAGWIFWQRWAERPEGCPARSHISGLRQQEILA